MKLLIISTEEGCAVFTDSPQEIEVELSLLNTPESHSESPDPTDDGPDPDIMETLIQAHKASIYRHHLRCISGIPVAVKHGLIPSME